MLVVVEGEVGARRGQFSILLDLAKGQRVQIEAPEVVIVLGVLIAVRLTLVSTEEEDLVLDADHRVAPARTRPLLGRNRLDVLECCHF